MTKTPEDPTVYEVKFEDAAREAAKAGYSYAWTLTLPGGDDCTVETFDADGPRASWKHPDCFHSPGETIKVVITIGDDKITITGPAVGAPYRLESQQN